MEIGIKKGEHVAIWATNVAEWVALQFATAKIGAVLVTVNTSYESAELEYILVQSDSSALFLVQCFKDTDYVETINAVVPELKTASCRELSCERLPFLKNVIFLGDAAPPGMHPREIEEFLYTCPKVADVQIYGVPDRKYGEQVMAAIKVKDGMECTAEEIKVFCKGRIANCKIPYYVKFVDEYPMTASGKIQKFKLREMAIREFKLENAVET